MLVAVSLLALLPPRDQAPLLSKRTLTCRDWATVANEYIALGEAGALARLKSNDATDRPFPVDVPLRKGLLCRILFAPRGAKPLAPPRFGGLILLYHSMPTAVWPAYPLVEQDGVWFLLSEGYQLGGKAERTADYVDYCRKAGNFRKAPLKVPTAAEASQALDRLLMSARWTALRWSYKGQGEEYSMSPEFVIDPLKAQTRF